MTDKELSYERVHELLAYDPFTGILTWRETGRGRYEGQEAGSVGSHGYKAVSVDGKKYLNHRLIWFWMTGSWPEGEVDHWDRIRLNNRWYNLRDVTPSGNAFNRKPTSKTGYKFIYLKDVGKPYKVQVSKGRKKTWHLGSYNTIEEAISIRDAFCQEANIETR